VQGVLVLEDGTRFAGEAFGAVEAGAVCAEVVFNTGMTGYQEVLTDPSYAGQIVVMTYPLIGNYGVRPEDAEAFRPLARGFVVREACGTPSHWSSEGDLDGYLRANGVLGLQGIDTRALVRHLRSHGTLRGVLAAGEGWDAAALAAAARAWRPGNLVAEATAPAPYAAGEGDVHVVLVDYGAKRNIQRSLAALGCRVTVVPAWFGARDILELDPDAVVLSNGPGDPEAVEGAPATIRALLASGTPVFGVCLGHQLLALALGGRTVKLPFGHRGVNQPVRDLRTGVARVTTQNHGYAVLPESLPERDAVVTHVNLNDGTPEGLAHRRLPAWSVQFHPEACPGPGDTADLFSEFVDRVRRPAAAAVAAQ
jgi:carbamoyl-phosphate synthase small subunit